MPKYHLPCPCGKSALIEPRQAGQTVTCVCGESLTAPKFREISNLRPADPQPGEQTSATSQWSALQGGLFVGGIICLLIGTAAASYFFWEFSRYNVTRPTLDQIVYAAESEEILEKAGAAELMETWEFINKEGLSRSGEPGWLRAQGIASNYKIAGSVAAAVALAGAGMVGASVFLRS